MRAMMSGRGMELAMRAGPGWEESAWMLRFGRGCRLKQVWHTAFLNHLKHRHEEVIRTAAVGESTQLTRYTTQQNAALV